VFEAQDDGLWYAYANGSVSGLASGFNSPTSTYYLSGVATNLDSSGSNSPADFGAGDPGLYTTWNELYYQDGAPGTGSWTWGSDAYSNFTNRIDMVNGEEVYRGAMYQ
jgi:hypothetical protein